jgi:hypothetical protein
VFLYPDYQGAQIVCGTGTGSKSYAAKGDGKCAYGTCYVYKQNLPCEDDTRQRLNGCCAPHSEAEMNLQETCLGYEQTITNTHSESVEYCTTYHSQYGSVGRMGTTDAGDDVKYAMQWLGANPSDLKVCQGDCDDDANCPDGSTCADGASAGCADGDSTDAARDETDYCSNSGSQDPRLQISCINEYTACCGHIERNGACNDDAPADFMASTNAALTDNACTGSVTAGDSADGGSGSDDDSSNNSTDNAIVASFGCVALLAAGAIVV